MSWFSDMWKDGSAAPARAASPQLVQKPRAERQSKDAKKGLPRFLGMAGDQGRASGGLLDQIRSRMRSAFTPSHPVMEAAMFAGREAVLRTLIRSIEDQQLHVVVYGARGIGKTSMLHILRQIAEEARYVVRYASCGEESRFDELFRAILRDIPLLYHANYDPTADEIEEGLSFADLLADRPLTVSAVSDLLDKISGTRVLILLDEFDRASDPEFRRSIAELVKNLSDRACRVQLVIAGVAQNLNEIIEHIPSIRRNILGLPVPKMSDEEVAELIRNGEAASGIAFTPDAVELVCAIARGMPYLASLISQNAGLSALDRAQKTVERLDVVNATRQALEEIELRLSATMRHRIDGAYAGHRERELGPLAHTALQHGGRLVPADVEQIAELGGRGKSYLVDLAAATGLVRPIADDPGEAYTFVDDGIPIYLWVRFAKEFILENARPHIAAAVRAAS